MGRRVTVRYTIPAESIARAQEFHIGTLLDASVGLYQNVDAALGVLEYMEGRETGTVGARTLVERFVVWLPTVAARDTFLLALETMRLRLGATLVVVADVNAAVADPDIRLEVPSTYWV